MMVAAAIWEHKHGLDVWVFRNADAAWKLREELAVQYWEEEFPDDPMPEDPSKAADEFFCESERNFFSTFETELI